ncbi:MAG: Ppx/GppA family phosphatase [Caulobacteraceae bacterium]|nr:Ppx/GppA family phosphatase [Caulobacteraceae bacterium]
MSARLADNIRDVAVVDVGSNSVRLVTYRMEGRAIWTVYNEKVLAGLGREVAATGRLSRQGVEQAVSALRRFRAVIDGAAPHDVLVAATAAVREASDGAAFVERVKAEAGLDIRVLSGREEAHYSAYGVVAGCPEAQGLVGDLGGSSLELVRLGRDGEPGDGVTLPLGPFALGAPNDFDLTGVRARTSELLKGARRFASPEFHAVGGAWRTLALIHMVMADYPLKIVHQYELSARDVADVARFVGRQSRTSLERIQGVSRKRADVLPWAAVVLETLIESLDLKRIIFSAYGLREGLLYQALPRKERSKDPLIEGCAALGRRLGVSPELGGALAGWLAPAFKALPPVFAGEGDARLLQAACRLADIGARLHPEHRAELAFIQVLHAPIAGQGHAERAFLAAAVHARYGGASTPYPEAPTIRRLLDEASVQRAKVLGLAMRLGCDLAGRAPAPLRDSSLEFHKTRVVVTADKARADILMGEQTAKRANALAQAMGLELEVKVG